MRACPVLRLIILTETPGTTLALGSVIVPFNAPVAAVCAHDLLHQNKKHKNITPTATAGFR
jgi:hypothetical protein